MNEGVIKFHLDHTFGPPLPKSLWEEIGYVREKLFSLGLIGEKEGIGYGNISKRTERDGFVITATQTGGLKRLTKEHYALVDSYDEERFVIGSTGPAKPSSEAFTHAAVYALSRQISWVVHIHSNPIWKMMIEKDYLKSAPVPYGTKEMAREVKRIYETIDPLKEPMFAMSGHEDGVMIFAENAENALTIAEDLYKRAQSV